MSDAGTNTAIIVSAIALVGAPIGAATSWLLNRTTRKKEQINSSVTAAESAVASLSTALSQVQKDLAVALTKIDELEKQIRELRVKNQSIT